MKNRNRVFTLKIINMQWLIVLMALLLFSCSKPPSFTRTMLAPNDNLTLLKAKQNTYDFDSEVYIKFHMKDATVYIMKDWVMSQNDSIITGLGVLLDVNRNFVKKDEFQIPLRDIVLVETNEPNPNPSIISLAVISGVSLAMTVYCILNPKSCFGSCPTFYVSNGSEMQLQAEGFSGAIAPSLEDKDIDALYFAKPDNGNLVVKMTNEALETHIVRYADILAVPKKENSRVFVTNESKFFQAEEIIAPKSVKADEGDITDKIKYFDGSERFSLADSSDLSQKEIIEIEFNDLKAGKKGLVLSYRQTLMTTYIFYSTLSYMGKSAGDYLAMLERDDGSFMKSVYGSKEVLGGIKVFIQEENQNWKEIGEFFELGPISTDIQLLQLDKNFKGNCKLRLELTKGLWRINYLALVNNYEEVQPVRIQPSYVIKDNEHDTKALDDLTDMNKTLATLPGDEYIFNYPLPDKNQSYEFFLESKGYYLEWMRNEWLKDENPLMLSKLILNPEQFFKDLAPEFKKVEPSMEDSFWGSRYVKK